MDIYIYLPSFHFYCRFYTINWFLPISLHYRSSKIFSRPTKAQKLGSFR
ncbi:hypothetical protein Patl1_26958 [Pistacia atlantica]|uniref:Uncharacterized protein n=1 Tax=Pistacia atlantica TaxID=434234 RepID=A0ACC1B4Z2_9ROSI|nr:hypothetical protein Patl1_26958 [Pistacia atlantica]